MTGAACAGLTWAACAALGGVDGAAAAAAPPAAEAEEVPALDADLESTGLAPALEWLISSARMFSQLCDARTSALDMPDTLTFPIDFTSTLQYMHFECMAWTQTGEEWSAGRFSEGK